jgi:hypothetical protein
MQRKLAHCVGTEVLEHTERVEAADVAGRMRISASRG